MLRSLNTGVTGIRQFQTALDIIGNNLANINTVGFKGGRVEFSDTLNQTLRAATPDTATNSGNASIQVGNGVEVAGIKTSFTQGAVNQTGVATDLAITGEGFFIVKNKATNELFATRSGDFRTDDKGFLVTNQGFRVQGFSAPPAAGPIADYLDTEGTDDLQLNIGTLPAGLPATAATAGITNINIGPDGKINILLSDGSQYIRGQVLLQRYTNPNALRKLGNNLYSGLTQAGQLTGVGKTNTNLIGAKANSSGLGRIEAGALEISNVDISREFSTLITTQRALQANARVVTASDDVLQEIIRIVR
jgi:flagellar hook protein FlgE